MSVKNPQLTSYRMSKTESFSPGIRKETMRPVFAFLFDILPNVLVRAVSPEEEIEHIQTGKEAVTLYSQTMRFYIQKIIKDTHGRITLISEVSEIVESTLET